MLQCSRSVTLNAYFVIQYFIIRFYKEKKFPQKLRAYKASDIEIVTIIIIMCGRHCLRFDQHLCRMRSLVLLLFQTASPERKKSFYLQRFNFKIINPLLKNMNFTISKNLSNEIV